MKITTVLLSYAFQINEELSRYSRADLEKLTEDGGFVEAEALFDLKFNPKNFNLDIGSSNGLNQEENKKYQQKKAELLVKFQQHKKQDQGDSNKNLLLNKLNSIMVHLIDSIVRTNFFLKKDFISIKISCEEIEKNGLFNYTSKPLFETFVFAMDFEAIHIRGGKVSRGGIRHSERVDYRNEVLALQETQNLKNVIIIPRGAKGGFLIKNNQIEKGQEKIFAIKCYQDFLRGLLDITDNLLLEGDIFSTKNTFINKNVVCYDEKDYYLVVAADKGTGDFSDFANEVSEEYDFWLQDAFASGGKNGYSHKELGITAKGALECVEQHLIDLKLTSPLQGGILEVFCFGNMAGDVAGNGMLYSKNFKLLAAVDSKYIFIDPNPQNLEASFEERVRLFEQEKKWSDYNKNLISAGGGVFIRTDEKILISSEIMKRFKIDKQEISGNDLIKKLMQYEYDVFWSGAIGTIIKASIEDNNEIKDKNSEAIRIDARDLKSKIFAEGANLSITPKGRVEYSLRGGMVNADFIDNSGGVNCSDYEVNIKIALNQLNIDLQEKKQIIKNMEKEICFLVLQNNKMQAEFLSKEYMESSAKVLQHYELINFLKENKDFALILENFPTLEELTQRVQMYKMGLTKPELAILLSLSKINMKQAILGSEIDFNDSNLNVHLETYFPALMKERYQNLILNHPLKKDIIVNQLCNEIINVNGF
jgi:glutamate dehydrogenase